MKRNEIEFDAEALVGSVEAFAAHVQGKHKLTLRTTQLSLKPSKPALEPKTFGTAAVAKHRPLLSKLNEPQRRSLRQRAATILYGQKGPAPRRSPRSSAGSAGSGIPVWASS